MNDVDNTTISYSIIGMIEIAFNNLTNDKQIVFRR